MLCSLLLKVHLNRQCLMNPSSPAKLNSEQCTLKQFTLRLHLSDEEKADTKPAQEKSAVSRKPRRVLLKPDRRKSSFQLCRFGAVRRGARTALLFRSLGSLKTMSLMLSTNFLRFSNGSRVEHICSQDWEGVHSLSSVTCLSLL